MNTSSTTTATSRRLAVLVALALSGASCGFGESGIAPPADRIFFPAGIAVDPGGEWLYVVNSNSDLRFNAGTVVAVDLEKARVDRQNRIDPVTMGALPTCPNSFFADPPRVGYCCIDAIDPRIVNCDERGYIESDATVSIGSFGGTVEVQSFERNGQPARRLFVAVRAEPSLTFIDVVPGKGRLTMRCTPEDEARPNVFCDDDWRIRIVQQPDGSELKFQEEPHAMVLDDTVVGTLPQGGERRFGVLYVGHLGGAERGLPVIRGVSVIDICDPVNKKPQLVSILREALPGTNSFGVTSLSHPRPGDPTKPLYATGEFVSEIAELVHRTPEQVVCDSPQRDLTLVAGRRFGSPAFGTRGADLRGLVISEERERAFVLHRQYASRGEYNPPSVVALDRRPDTRGLPANAPTGVVEVCNGPNRMFAHDAGRGPRLFVNCFEGGQIYVIEPDSLTVEAIIELGAGPVELVFAPNDPTLAFVAGFANNNVSVIDLKPGSPTEFRVVQRIGFARARVVQR